MTGWNSGAAAGAVGAGAVTLVEGSSFCISGVNGDMAPDRPHGVFYQDTRIVSRWDLFVNEHPVEALAALTKEPFRAIYLARPTLASGGADSTLLVERERRVGGGLREDILIRNFALEPADCTVTLAVAADFADLFDVKEGRRRPDRSLQHAVRVDGDRLSFDSRTGEHHRGVVVQAAGAVLTDSHIIFTTVIPARGAWSATVLVRPVVDGTETASPFPVDRPAEESEPARRFIKWRLQSPIARTDDAAVEKVLRRSQSDLGALRIFDPDHPDRAVVAAGAPWFMALFGRDSLLSSLMALPIDQSLALGTLQTLAEHQGSGVNPLTEEEPGRILHEVRLGVNAGLALGGGNVYYGTVDATPLFVILLGELRRWGFARSEVDALLPHADRALRWMTHYGDRDGDGFVEYERANESGLVNQGWKDSWDGINFADGTLPDAPIALCEVQAYTYGAYLARSHFAQEDGDRDLARLWASRAAELKRNFNERFWLPDRGYYAVALDGAKRPVDACTSNIGHCLWSGIVDDDKASLVADRLLSPEMFTGWGVRTLGSDMGAYNPVSYHNGSVWPHDNALVAAGLMRYGFVEHAQKIALGLFRAAERFDGRLPELFCGFDRAEFSDPVPYPTSCSPQAWAATTPVHLIRTLMRFDPWIPHGLVWLAPAVPAELGRLRIENVGLAGAHLSVDVTNDGFTVDGLPDAIHLIRHPRKPLTDALPSE